MPQWCANTQTQRAPVPSEQIRQQPCSQDKGSHAGLSRDQPPVYFAPLLKMLASLGSQQLVQAVAPDCTR